MKKALAGIGALMAMVLLIVMITVVNDEDDRNKGLNCFGGSGTEAGQVAPLPAGSTSKPTKDGTTQLTSGYKSPDRPGHRGVDLAGPEGTPIYAFADGVVAKSGEATGFGHWIVLNHNIDGKLMSTVYGHMYADGLLVKEGEQVRAGQMIAKIGNDGESTGAHLHFEVWNGSREAGTETDPTPFISGGANPGSAGGAQPGDSPSSTGTQASAEPKPVSAQSGVAEMPELPAEKGSEEHMTVDSVRIMRAISSKFPQVKQIGGWRPSDPYPDHPSGRAVDIMIPNYSSEEGKALGEQINGYLLTNAATFNVKYTIFRQQYKQPDGTGNTMEDRGGDTANHFDHVHVTVDGDGHGLATPGQRIDGAIPDGGTWGASPGGCLQGGVSGGAGGDLNEGEVPPAFVPWIRKAAQTCPSVKPALLAAQEFQESSFNPMAESIDPNTGEVIAQGAAQFIPSTWATYGRDDDGNGKTSPFDIGDAVMAQARYMCKIAEILDPDIDSGKIKPPAGPYGREKLYLAGYNAGEGAVQSAGGMPSGSADYENQTKPYVEKIAANIAKFDKAA